MHVFGKFVVGNLHNKKILAILKEDVVKHSMVLGICSY